MAGSWGPFVRTGTVRTTSGVVSIVAQTGLDIARFVFSLPSGLTSTLPREVVFTPSAPLRATLAIGFGSCPRKRNSPGLANGAKRGSGHDRERQRGPRAPFPDDHHSSWRTFNPARSCRGGGAGCGACATEGRGAIPTRIAAPGSIIAIRATVYNKQRSLLQWRDPDSGAEYEAWSNIDFNHLPPQPFRVERPQVDPASGDRQYRYHDGQPGDRCHGSGREPLVCSRCVLSIRGPQIGSR